jgi:hypothetical protein
MDARPILFATALALAACAGFVIGSYLLPERQQIALNWSVPSGADAFPHVTR